MLALTSCTVAAFGAGVYKWVDEKGAVQYRDTPPPQGVTYRTLQKTIETNHDPSITLQQLREKVKALDEERTAAQAKNQDGKQIAQRTKNCEVTKKNLDILATSANPVRIDNEGNRVPLSDADRQAAVEEQQRYLEQHCSP
jgi:hypothetical protein